jgi:hypothetical protein
VGAYEAGLQVAAGVAFLGGVGSLLLRPPRPAVGVRCAYLWDHPPDRGLASGVKDSQARQLNTHL